MGRHRPTSDVAPTGRRLLEKRERKIEAPPAALIEGEQSGASIPFGVEEFIARKRRK